MARYFFSLYDHAIEPDDCGTELPDRAAARIEAIRFAGEVLRDEPHHLDDDAVLRVAVTDADGRQLFEVSVQTSEPD